MKIDELGLYLLRIPFRRSFRHARAIRKETNNLAIMIKLDNGTKGFGEGIPREYVTGETALNSFNFMERKSIRHLQAISFKEKDAFLESLDSVLKDFPQASRCAVEIACLDAFSRSHNIPLYSIFTQRPCAIPRYSGIMSAEGFLKTCAMAFFFKYFGFKDIKLKVGFDNDLDRLKALRRIVGVGADIRLDANGAWKPEEAVEKIKAMKSYNISMVEQPVEAVDLAGFKKVTDEAGVKIMADESLKTPGEAENLAKDGICHSFNIRLSKCGGFLNSLRIAEVADKYGLSYQIGCHVGETGILTAAGRHLAACLSNTTYFEGGYSRFLLREDIIKGDISFGRAGAAEILTTPGLGVEVDEDRLAKYTYKSIKLKDFKFL